METLTEKVKGLYKEGLGVEAIGVMTGRGASAIRKILNKKRFKIPPLPELKRRRLVLLAEHGMGIDELKTETGLSANYIVKQLKHSKARVAEQQQIRYIHNAPKKVKRFRCRDRMIIQGALTLAEMAQRAGISCSGMDSYTRKTGQHDYWKERRKQYLSAAAEENNRQKEKERFLVGLIDAYVRKKLHEADKDNKDDAWAFKKTEKNFASLRLRKKSDLSFIKVFRILLKYRKAEKEGRRESYEELGKGLASQMAVRRILKRTGLGSMYWNIKNMKRYTKEEIPFVKRAAELRMGAVPAAYFSGIPPWVITGYRAKNSIKYKGPYAIKYFGSNVSFECLDERVSSRLYEALDAGFTKEEAIEYARACPKAFDHAVEHRKDIESRIIDALRHLYPEREITRPWV